MTEFYMIGNTTWIITLLCISKNCRPTCIVNILGAIMKSQPGSTSMDAEGHIAETLKHAPGLVRKRANVSIWQSIICDCFKTLGHLDLSN